MADWPISGGAETRAENFGADNSNSFGLNVTASGTANTKGSYVELIASTGIDYNMVHLFVRNADVDDQMFDISIGSTGNEEVIISNIMLSSVGGTNRVGVQLDFPIYIPSGTRISCRCQAAVGSTIMNISGIGYSGGIGGTQGIAKIVDYGTNLSDSGGTAVDAGATINTKGAWSQITSSTNEDLKEIIMMIGLGSNNAPTAAPFLVDIGIGAAASEEIIVPDVFLYSFTVNDTIGMSFVRIPMQIPSGTRIAIRMQSDTNNSVDRVLDFAIYGAV